MSLTRRERQTATAAVGRYRVLSEHRHRTGATKIATGNEAGFSYFAGPMIDSERAGIRPGADVSETGETPGRSAKLWSATKPI